ncbi:MAG: hypothetical protein V7K40_16205 [Nostoc sp.]
MKSPFPHLMPKLLETLLRSPTLTSGGGLGLAGIAVTNNTFQTSS